MKYLLYIFKKVISNPPKAFRYLSIALKKRFIQKSEVLVIIGLDPNGEFDILVPGYKRCFAFEANPDRYKKLVQKHGDKENVFLYNYAVATYDGEIQLNISSNNEGASSSVGNFDKEWLKHKGRKNIKMTKTIKVPCINLMSFLRKLNINYIDDYISDIQGFDLEVLKTLRPMIETRQIGSIKCEVTKDAYRNIYHDLPDNTETGFNELLGKHYRLVAVGQGLLIDEKFDSIPEDAWEMDCKWTLI